MEHPVEPLTFFEQPELNCTIVVRQLVSTIEQLDDPLAVILASVVFHEHSQFHARDAALVRTERFLQELTEISDSGLQIRDCLLASLYFFAAKRAGHDTILAERQSLTRIQFASENDWFGDSTLATAVALIADEVVAGGKAKQYLQAQLPEWMATDYAQGVAQCCYIDAMSVGQKAASYIAHRDWSRDRLDTQSWALLAMTKLREAGYASTDSLRRLSITTLKSLANSKLAQTTRDWKGAYHAKNDSLTAFDYALATHSLHVAGYDSIFGVPRSFEPKLRRLVENHVKLQRGGIVVSKQWVRLSNVVLFLFLFLLLFELLRLTGIDTLYQALVSLVISGILGGFTYLLTRRLAARGVAIGVLGDGAASTEDGKDGEYTNSTT